MSSITKAADATAQIQDHVGGAIDRLDEPVWAGSAPCMSASPQPSTAESVARRAEARTRRKAGRESRADRGRRLRLEAEFLKMMEEALSRPNDRTLFGIEMP